MLGLAVVALVGLALNLKSTGDALEFVDLPNTAATYDVHATFDEFRSNAMEITIE